MKTMTASNDEISETDDEVTQLNRFMKLSVCIFYILHKINFWTIKLTNHSYTEWIKRVCTLWKCEEKKIMPSWEVYERDISLHFLYVNTMLLLFWSPSDIKNILWSSICMHVGKSIFLFHPFHVDDNFTHTTILLCFSSLIFLSIFSFSTT